MYHFRSAIFFLLFFFCFAKPLMLFSLFFCSFHLTSPVIVFVACFLNVCVSLSAFAVHIVFVSLLFLWNYNKMNSIVTSTGTIHKRWWKKRRKLHSKKRNKKRAGKKAASIHSHYVLTFRWHWKLYEMNLCMCLWELDFVTRRI